MYKKFIILIILLIISCIYFYKEKFDNYGLKLVTCDKDKDTKAICINKINQDTMGYANKETKFNSNLNQTMPIVYPFVPKNNNNCNGLLQNWNDRGCDDQCKPLGYEYYRSDLNGCVNNQCIPSIAACTDPTFLSSSKCKQDVCSDNKILMNNENNTKTNNQANLSNMYNYIPISNIDHAMPNPNEVWRKIPDYMCSTNYTYKNAGKGGAEQCKKYCLEREDNCQDGYSYLYNYGWNQCRFAKKEYGRCNKGSGGQGDHYYKVDESDPCLKQTDKWCLDNRPKKYKWGRKLPGLASQGQSTPQWRCYADQALTPDKSKFNESSPDYWTSPDLQKVWDKCKEPKPILCSSDFGKTGEPCCGVKKSTMRSKDFSDLTAEHTCSKYLPKCEGYRPGYTWGTCKAAPKPTKYKYYGNRRCGSTDSFNRFSITSVDECKKKCNDDPNCNTIAIGPTCVTYKNCVMSSKRQSWGYDYYQKE